MILLLTLAASLSQAAQAPVALKHSFTKGIKSEYEVEAELDIDSRGRGLTTFLPDNKRFKYSIFTNTLDDAHDVASVRYSRPSLSITGFATADTDPRTIVEKVDWLALLQISPVNEIIDDKDISPKKPKPKTDQLIARGGAGVPRRQEELIQPYLDDIERLSVFIGGPETSLDFEPRLSLDAVKVGDTWQRTLSYQPQKLASKSGKTSTVVKRVDLTYTYKGIVESHGQKYQHVHGELNLKTDIGEFYNQFFDATPDQTGLKSIPLTLSMKMEFDLDPKTNQTVFASLKSEGSFKVFVTAFPEAYEEENVRGSSEMHLVSNKPVK